MSSLIIFFKLQLSLNSKHILQTPFSEPQRISPYSSVLGFCYGVVRLHLASPTGSTVIICFSLASHDRYLSVSLDLRSLRILTNALQNFLIGMLLWLTFILDFLSSIKKTTLFLIHPDWTSFIGAWNMGLISKALSPLLCLNPSQFLISLSISSAICR